MHNNRVKISVKLGQASRACFYFVHLDIKYFPPFSAGIWEFAERSRSTVLFVIFVSIAQNMIDTRQWR